MNFQETEENGKNDKRGRRKTVGVDDFGKFSAELKIFPKFEILLPVVKAQILKTLCVRRSRNSLKPFKKLIDHGENWDLKRTSNFLRTFLFHPSKKYGAIFHFLQTSFSAGLSVEVQLDRFFKSASNISEFF